MAALVKLVSHLCNAHNAAADLDQPKSLEPIHATRTTSKRSRATYSSDSTNPIHQNQPLPRERHQKEAGPTQNCDLTNPTRQNQPHVLPQSLDQPKSPEPALVKKTTSKRSRAYLRSRFDQPNSPERHASGTVLLRLGYPFLLPAVVPPAARLPSPPVGCRSPSGSAT